MCSASAKGSPRVGADGLEDAVAVEEAAVVDGDLGLLGGEEGAVDGGDAGHAASG